MKKCTLFGIVLLAFAACNSTPESKMDALIREAVERTLYDPKSYEVIQTEIDSSFSIIDFPDFWEKAAEYNSLLRRVSNLEDEVRREKCRMKSFQELSHAYYEEAQGEYEKAVKKFENIKKKAKKVEEEIREMKEQIDQMKGYKVYHHYRSILEHDVVFIINADMSKIIAEYDPDDYFYKRKKKVAEEIYELLFEDGVWLDDSY